MTNRRIVQNLNWPRWKQELLIAVLVLIAAFRLYTSAYFAAENAGLLGPVVTFGGSFQPDIKSPRHFYRVTRVAPGRQMDRAGFQVGDSIRTESRITGLVAWPVGHIMEFERDHGGARSRGQLTLEPMRQDAATQRVFLWQMLNRLASLISAAIGCFILWRGWGNRTAMLLGAAINPIHLSEFRIPLAFGGSAASEVFTAITSVMDLLVD